MPNSTVTACSWDDATCSWTVTTAQERSYEADAIVIATGQLHQPAFPRIEGAETFAGHSFHSAEWDHDYDLRGKRVAVVGTGASAVQFVPEIAEQAERLTVFQRTGNWFLPRKNRPYPAAFKALVKHVPGVQAFRRGSCSSTGESLTLAIRHPRTVGPARHARSAAFMRWQLKDPELRRKVWPDYTFGCKRVLFSSHFLPALQRPNVELVTDAIARMTPGGIVTADGRLHEVDCVIWGTGLQDQRLHVPDGDHRRRRAVTCARRGPSGAHAHLGMTVPGFPSMFVMYGPNTNTSGGSIIVYLEAQAAYIRQALQQVRDRGAGGDRRARRGRGRQRPRGAGALRRDRLDAVRLLVSRRGRPDRRQLARLHARVPRAARASSIRPSTASCSGPSASRRRFSTSTAAGGVQNGE